MKKLLLSSALIVAATVVSVADTWIVYNTNHVPVILKGGQEQEVSGAGVMTPVQQLTNALAQAASGSTIIIKPGTYDLAAELTATKAADNDPNGLSYLIIPKKKFFINGENTTHWSQKTTAQETVLKGGSGGRIIYGYTGNGRSSVFQHLTFEGGNAQGGTGTLGNNGGAIGFFGTEYCQPFVSGYASNCVFRTNSAVTYGGATTDISVYDSFFTNNVAAQGGAAYGRSQNTYGSDNIRYTNDFISCVFVANVTTNATSGGGALYCEIPGRLEGCTFVMNRTATDGTVGYGGAIYAKNTDISRIFNCAFTNNVAATGGAIYVCGDSKLNELAACTFVGNHAGKYATLIAEGGYGTITGCTFKDNVAQDSYAGVAAPSMALAGTVENCIFDNNTNKDANVGSQIHFAQQVTGCTFKGAGDMMALNYDRCLFDGCLFDYDSYGSGMILYNTDTGVGHLWNCLFQNNTMHVAIDNATGKMLEIANCTFVSNRVIRSVNRNPAAKGSTDAGYLIFAYRASSVLPSSNRVVNCAFYNNYRHKNNSDEVERNDVNFYATTGSNPKAGNILDHCYYETATFKFGTNDYTPIQTDNVTNVAPKFVAGDPKYPNTPYYMPKHASPLRNAGQCLDWMVGEVDFAGNPRVLGAIPDIGCYECNLQPYGMMLFFR